MSTNEDIQEHLRSLHYVIATASVVLLLTVFSFPETQYTEARKQLAKIGEILGAWDGDFVMKTIGDQISKGHVPAKLESDTSKAVLVDWPSPQIYWGGSQGLGTRGREDLFRKKPTNLHDFFSFWDSLPMCLDLDLPRKILIEDLRQAGRYMVPQEEGPSPEPSELIPTEPDHKYGPYFYRIFPHEGSIYVTLRGANPENKKMRHFSWRAGPEGMGSPIGMSIFARFLKKRISRLPR